jgi:hypothetical protein
MTTGPRVRASRCPASRRTLIGAIARRATSIAATTAACNVPHTTARALALTHRQRPRARQNSKHMPRTGRRTIACAPTSRGQRSREQRGSRRAHRCARALGRRSPVDLPCRPRTFATATIVPRWGPQGGRKLRSGPPVSTAERSIPARNDNASRDRIALGGGAAV